jgi:hypothetical protein
VAAALVEHSVDDPMTRRQAFARFACLQPPTSAVVVGDSVVLISVLGIIGHEAQTALQLALSIR